MFNAFLKSLKDATKVIDNVVKFVFLSHACQVPKTKIAEEYHFI